MHNTPTGSMSDPPTLFMTDRFNLFTINPRCRQTVFYTPETLTINSGDQVRGSLSCAPNARNPRDLDIRIKYRINQDGDQTAVQYKMCVPFVSSLSTVYLDVVNDD